MSEERTTCRVQLNYPLERVKEPILYRLIKDFGLVPNIRKANIEVHSGGFIVLDLSGEPQNMRKGLDWLETCGVTVRKIEEE